MFQQVILSLQAFTLQKFSVFKERLRCHPVTRVPNFQVTQKVGWSCFLHIPQNMFRSGVDLRHIVLCFFFVCTNVYIYFTIFYIVHPNMFMQKKHVCLYEIYIHIYSCTDPCNPNELCLEWRKGHVCHGWNRPKTEDKQVPWILSTTKV